MSDMPIQIYAIKADNNKKDMVFEQGNTGRHRPDQKRAKVEGKKFKCFVYLKYKNIQGRSNIKTHWFSEKRN